MIFICLFCHRWEYWKHNLNEFIFIDCHDTCDQCDFIYIKYNLIDYITIMSRRCFKDFCILNDVHIQIVVIKVFLQDSFDKMFLK